MSIESDRTAVAWRGAMWSAGINALGSPLELFFLAQVPTLPVWPPLASAGVGLVLFIVLRLRRHRPTRAGAAAAFLINNAVIVAMLWSQNTHWAELGARWAPFQANKLGALTVGLLAPELWVGIVTIAGYWLSAALHWYTFAPELRAQLTAGEPMITFIYAAFSVALLVQSLRRFALQRRLVERDHEAATLDRLARVLMAVRDLTNTPVQTILLTAASLRAQNPDLAPALARLDRALAQLRELSRVLAEHESDIQWHPGIESFDPLKVLQRTPRPGGLRSD